MPPAADLRRRILTAVRCPPSGIGLLSSEAACPISGVTAVQSFTGPPTPLQTAAASSPLHLLFLSTGDLSSNTTSPVMHHSPPLFSFLYSPHGRRLHALYITLTVAPCSGHLHSHPQTPNSATFSSNTGHQSSGHPSPDAAPSSSPASLLFFRLQAPCSASTELNSTVRHLLGSAPFPSAAASGPTQPTNPPAMSPFSQHCTMHPPAKHTSSCLSKSPPSQP